MMEDEEIITFRDRLKRLCMRTSDAFKEKMNDVRYYIRMRFFVKPHITKNGCRPGGWLDADSRIMNSAFNILVEHVENEVAEHNLRMMTAAERLEKATFLQRLWCKPWMKWTAIRSLPLALDYYTWLMEASDSPPQPSSFERAGKIVRLYDWWVNVRPNRVDPYEYYLQPFDAALEKKYGSGGNVFTRRNLVYTKEELAMHRQLTNLYWKLEETYREEDNAMLKMLIEVRHYLWT